MSLFKPATNTAAFAKVGGSGARPIPEWWDRFWANVDKRSPRDCWEWQGSKRKGYGRIRINGKQISAHRLVMIAEFGRIPDGLLIKHGCDNPACVNPMHLSFSITADNHHDKAIRGRVRGEKNPRAKLTEEDVLAIRASSETLEGLAIRYGVSRPTIEAIRYRRNWRHI